MSAYAKNVVRTILGNSRRYIAMMLITALGVAFFVGLRSTSPDMDYTLDTYFNEQGMYDLRLLTSLGITKEQAGSIARLPGVEQVYPAYYCDMFITINSDKSLARLHSLEIGENGAMPLGVPFLMEGRFPEAVDECLVSERFLALRGGKLGDIVTVSTGSDEELSDTLHRDSFRIVGLVETPVYISPTLGPSGKGSGSLNTFMYIPAENFVSEIYTEVYIRLKESRAVSRFSEQYEGLLEAAADFFKQKAESIAWRRYDDIQAEGAEKIAEGRQEITDAKRKLADAEQELADAREKITEGEQELADKTAEFYRELAAAERELADGGKKLEDARRELAEAKITLAEGEEDLRKLKDGMQKLADELKVERLSAIPGKLRESLNRFYEGEEELAGAREQIKRGRWEIAENKRKLQEAEAELASNAGALEQARIQLAWLEAQLTELQAEREQLLQSVDGIPPEFYPQEVIDALDLLEAAERQFRDGILLIRQQLAAAEYAREEIEKGWQQIAGAEKVLDEGYREWLEGHNKLEEEREKLAELASELEIESIEGLPKGVQDLLDKIPEAEQEIADGKQEIADGEATLAEKTIEYEDGLLKLEEGRIEGLEGIAEGEEKLAEAWFELRDGQQKFNDAKAEADETLTDAERKIIDAEKELRDLDEPKSYALGLDSNIGFFSFKQDSERIGLISLYFPLIFFLVAALVSFTSMVRVVEQDRPTAGALQSLGYRPSAILRKYAVFALAVCIPGCGLGILVGCNLFPSLIFNQGYKIMYLMPNLLTPLQIRYCVLAFGISLVSVLVPTLAVYRSELSDVPAVLLRPKPPRSGKRVWLERVPFIWNRLSFSAKVTARNILRYKKRFFMTVAGVAGCTAIVLTGFGLQDSINIIAQRQFGSVFLYDMEISLKENLQPADIAELEALVENSGEIGEFLYCYKNTYEINTLEVTVCAPEDEEVFARFVRLRDPDRKGIHELNGSGAVITQKLAKLLAVRPGEEISIIDTDGNTFQTEITGIVENYVAHYIYLSSEGFRQMFGRDAEYNAVLCLAPGLDSSAQSGIGSELLKNEAVNGLSFLSKTRDFYTDMVNSLNFVVVVLLISGALLSFIVLFSLTGINIDERERELATLKVLGFYEKETAMYIFRENVITNLIGTLTGLPAGVLLHRMVITTAEVDMVMFGREIHPLSYGITAALSFLFLAFVNWIMGFHIRKIDMIESLKSVE